MTYKPQINPGGYASPIIADRFQIMSSLVGGTFFVVDLTLDGHNLNVRDPKGDILRFETKKDAEFFILSFTANEEIAITTTSKPPSERNKAMATKKATALAVKELAAARKSAKAMDAQIGETEMVPAAATKKIGALRAKVAPKAPALKEVAAPAVKVVAAPKGGAKVVPLKTVKAKANGSTLPKVQDGEGSGAYIRRLLKAGYVDTQAILAAVHSQFEGSKAGPSDVSWNKGKLKKDEGWVPPAAV
jgi:hypothetical protein